MIRKGIITATLVLALSAGTTHAETPLGVVIVDEKLLDHIEIDGRAAWSGDATTYETRTEVDSHVARHSLAVHHQMIVALRYTDTDFRDVRSVAIGGVHQPMPDPPVRDVVNCGVNDVTGLCRYTETVTFDIGDALLRAKAATGITIDLTTHRGGVVHATLSPDQIARQFIALDDHAGKHAYPAKPEVLKPLPLGLVFTAMTAQDLMSNYRLDHGLMIQEVQEDSAVSPTAVRAEDILLAVNGKPVSTQADVDAALVGLKPGSTATLSVWHDDETVDIAVGF